MKKKFLSLGMATVLMVSALGVNPVNPTVSYAAETSTVKDEASVITVNGKGTIKIKPDIAYISVGYDARNKNANVAQSEARTKMDAILKALKAQGIKEDDMKTTNISLYKASDYTKDQKVEYYYMANQTIEVTIRDLNKAGFIIDAAADAGSNNMGSIRFTVEDQETYYKDALKLAIKNAATKADAMLGYYGYKAGKPSKINEASYFGGIVYRDSAVYAEKAVMAPSTQVQVGTIEITADVTVEYKF